MQELLFYCLPLIESMNDSLFSSLQASFQSILLLLK